MKSRTTLVFLTAGEIPKKTNLIYSQVIKVCDYFYKQKTFKDVILVSSIPIRTILYSFIKLKPVSFKWYHDFSFKAFILFSLIVQNSLFAFLCKHILSYNEAVRISKYIKIDNDSSYIFHCRSYMATQIGLKIKEINTGAMIKIVFDMRSILPPEFHYNMKLFGNFMYLSAKEWERSLLLKSDVSLLTTNRGIQMLKLENPDINLKKITITGLSIEPLSKDDFTINFEKKWANKRISYIGSVGLWHPQEIVEAALLKVEQLIDNCMVEIVTNSEIPFKISAKSIKHDQIEDYYKHTLAVVVPGKKPACYLESLQMSINLFSTKVTEALSVGVPIIVNAAIVEVANLVKDYRCGLVFSVNEKNEICFEEEYLNQINEKDFWLNCSINAYKIGRQYSFETTMLKYNEVYEEILKNVQ